LDTASGEVLTRPYDSRQVCRGKLPTLVAVYQRPYAWPRAGGVILAKGIYRLRAISMFKRGKE